MIHFLALLFVGSEMDVVVLQFEFNMMFALLHDSHTCIVVVVMEVVVSHGCVDS